MLNFRRLLLASLIIMILFPVLILGVEKVRISEKMEEDGPPVGLPSGVKYTYYPAFSKGNPGGSSFFREHAAYEDSVPNMIWPHINVDSNSVVHMILTQNTDDASEPQYIGYTNSTDGGGTFSPIVYFDTIGTISGMVTSSPVSDKVAIVYTDFVGEASGGSDYDNDVKFIISPDGTTWDFSDKVNITTFAAEDTFRAYCDVDAIYDYADNLHIIFNVVYYDGVSTSGSGAKLWHWSSSTGITEVASGWYDTNPGSWNRTVCKPNLGCDPSTGYLYATWTQFPRGDTSSDGYSNGEIYAAVSTDSGITWEEPHNLTRTHTPGCATGDCNSDHWASLASVVDGTLRISYINDKDAGGAVRSVPEGDWTSNNVKFLSVPASELVTAPDTASRDTSPGITVGTTWYDYQHNASMGKMIAVDGEGGIHLSWMKGFERYAADRHTYYNYRSPRGDWLAPGRGVLAEAFTRTGYTTMSLFPDGSPAVAYHTSLEYVDTTGPAAEIVLPEEDTYTTCENQEIIIYLDDPRGVNPSTISLAVEDLMYSISDAALSYTGSTLVFTPSSSFHDSQVVDVVLRNAEDSLGNSMEEPLGWTFNVDLSPPLPSEPQPAESSFVSCPDRSISILASDEGSGLNFSTLEFSMKGTTLTMSSSALSYESGLLYLYPSSVPFSFRNGEEVNVEISLEDNPDYCEPNDTTISWNYTIDIVGPVAFSPQPEPEAYIPTAQPRISIGIVDSLSGVDTSAVTLNINDRRLTNDSAGVFWSEDTLIYDPVIDDFSFSPGETVIVSLDTAYDSPDVCEPNNISSPYTWNFYIFTASSWLGDTAGSPGDTAYLPLEISNVGSYGVTSVSFKASVDSSRLSPCCVKTTDTDVPGWEVDSVNIAPTFLKGFISGSEISVEKATIAYVGFQVKSSVEQGEVIPVELDTTELNDDFNTITANGSIIGGWQVANWIRALKIHNRDMELKNSISFGLSGSASDGYDPGFDEVSLPGTPEGVYGAFILEDTLASHISYLSRDIRNGDEFPQVWKIKTWSDEGYITWNRSRLPAGRFTIEDTVDMYSDSIYHFSRAETVKIKYCRPTMDAYELSLVRGWNMISLPVIPMNRNLSRHFPYVLGEYYHYNPDRMRYEDASIAMPGKAIWLFSTVDTSVLISGMRVDKFTDILSPGWNMIGSPAQSVPVSEIEVTPESSIVSEIFSYDPGSSGYSMVDTLRPGEGYWIIATDSCQVEVGE